MNRKQDKDKRTTVITIRCKPADKRKWIAKATKRGQTLSEMTVRALNRKDENGR